MNNSHQRVRVSPSVRKTVNEDYNRRLRDAERIAGAETVQETSEELAKFWFNDNCDFCGGKSLEGNHTGCYEWSKLRSNSQIKGGN